MSIELLAILVPACMVITFGLLILVLLGEISRQKTGYRSRRKTKLTKVKIRVKCRALGYSIQRLCFSPFLLLSYLFQEVPTPVYRTPLQDELLGLLRQDWSLAVRLVEYERRRNQGMPEDWYWKAAIDRLIRDRR